jgi:phenylalanyl-tRNA synthetase beta chain
MMRISLNWLSEYIPVPFTPKELDHRLTMLGIEVEAIEHVGERWNKVVVGEVLEVTPHPNADKLRLTRVSIGNGEPLSIVCGAPNVRAGQHVPIAIIGADLGGGMVIKKAKIRGEASEGMICSERELGISQNHDGIWELPKDTALGLPLADALGLRDTIFEVGITPNRADCLSHIGIAREIRAITGEQVRLPSVSIAKKGGEIDKQVRVSLPQPELCPRYVAKLVKGVTIAPSPDWLKRRLEAVGLRPINNVVDVTNFVLMECGHPLHAFDFDLVENGQIEVRTAGGFADDYVTLDGKRRKMPPDALLITDGKNPLGIAGIMGGENSEIRDTTRNVLIESAYFNPTSIRKTAKQLGLSSDASYRFERGTDINILERAAERAAQMIVELAGGEIVHGMIDEYPVPLRQKTFRFRPSRANMLLGMSIPAERMREIFELLNIEVENSASTEWQLTSPSYRVDLEREEDAIEEVARIVGYDEIPTSTFERSLLTGMRDPLKLRDFDTLVRSTLISLGASECISVPLVSEKNALQFHAKPVELINPLNAERDRMRTSIAINLLEAARVSERFGASGQRIFEIGNVFHYSDKPEKLGHVSEKPELAILISGTQEAKTAYNAAAIPADIFLMKGIAESLLTRSGIREFGYSSEIKDLGEWGSSSNFLDSAQSLAIISGTQPVGLMGTMNREITKAYDLRSDVLLALFDYAALFEITRKIVENPPHVKALSKYPSVERDIAIVLTLTLSAKQIEDTIRGIARPDILRSIRLFDQFQSKEMKLAHEHSLAFHLVFRSDDRTLEEHEVDELIILIIKRLEGELHARLRV